MRRSRRCSESQVSNVYVKSRESVTDSLVAGWVTAGLVRCAPLPPWATNSEGNGAFVAALSELQLHVGDLVVPGRHPVAYFTLCGTDVWVYTRHVGCRGRICPLPDEVFATTTAGREHVACLLHSGMLVIIRISDNGPQAVCMRQIGVPGEHRHHRRDASDYLVANSQGTRLVAVSAPLDVGHALVYHFEPSSAHLSFGDTLELPPTLRRRMCIDTEGWLWVLAGTAESSQRGEGKRLSLYQPTERNWTRVGVLPLGKDGVGIGVLPSARGGVAVIESRRVVFVQRSDVINGAILQIPVVEVPENVLSAYAVSNSNIWIAGRHHAWQISDTRPELMDGVSIAAGGGFYVYDNTPRRFENSDVVDCSVLVRAGHRQLLLRTLSSLELIERTLSVAVTAQWPVGGSVRRLIYEPTLQLLFVVSTDGQTVVLHFESDFHLDDRGWKLNEEVQAARVVEHTLLVITRRRVTTYAASMSLTRLDSPIDSVELPCILSASFSSSCALCKVESDDGVKILAIFPTLEVRELGKSDHRTFMGSLATEDACQIAPEGMVASLIESQPLSAEFPSMPRGELTDWVKFSEGRGSVAVSGSVIILRFARTPSSMPLHASYDLGSQVSVVGVLDDSKIVLQARELWLLDAHGVVPLRVPSADGYPQAACIVGSSVVAVFDRNLVVLDPVPGGTWTTNPEPVVLFKKSLPAQRSIRPTIVIPPHRLALVPANHTLSAFDLKRLSRQGIEASTSLPSISASCWWRFKPSACDKTYDYLVVAVSGGFQRFALSRNKQNRSVELTYKPLKFEVGTESTKPAHLHASGPHVFWAVKNVVGRVSLNNMTEGHADYSAISSELWGEVLQLATAGEWIFASTKSGLAWSRMSGDELRWNQQRWESEPLDRSIVAFVTAREIVCILSVTRLGRDICFIKLQAISPDDGTLVAVGKEAQRVAAKALLPSALGALLVLDDGTILHIGVNGSCSRPLLF